MAVDPNQPEQEEAPKEKAKQEEGGGFIGWLKDSYNGLFKLLIEPLLPSRRVLMYMTLSFVLGLVWAYVISPVAFHSAAPNQLSTEAQELWVKLVAGAGTELRIYPPDQVSTLLGMVDSPQETIAELIEVESTRPDARNLLPALQEISAYAADVAGTEAPSSGSMITEIIMFVVAIVVFVLVVNIFAAVWGLLLGGLVSDAIRYVKPKTEAQKMMAAERAAIKKQRELEEKMKAEMSAAAAASDLGPSIMQRVSIYTKGRGYDDSFAIEDASDMFLGECGATIAKTIGDSQELAAVEVWLFDKEDFVRTLTKIFASEHAYNDPAIRSELDPKVENPATDIIMIEPGATIELQSKMLLVQAKIDDMTPGNAPGLPPNSHFSDLRIQIQGWEHPEDSAVAAKPPPVPAGAAASAAPAAPPPAAPAPGSGLPDLSSYEIGPPPEMPGQASAPTQPTTPPPQAPSPQATQPSSGGLPDLSSYEIGPPPPMPGQSQPAQEDEEDDPFAGAGDFTPLGS